MKPGELSRGYRDSPSVQYFVAVTQVAIAIKVRRIDEVWSDNDAIACAHALAAAFTLPFEDVLHDLMELHYRV